MDNLEFACVKRRVEPKRFLFYQFAAEDYDAADVMTSRPRDIFQI